MAILVLGTVVSAILGCLLWLVIGDKFPLRNEFKFTPLNNIVIYGALALVPVYLFIFFVFG